MRRLGVFLVVGMIAVATFATAAYSYVQVSYAGPKTWLPNYWQDSGYDSSPAWWYANDMHNKSCGGNSNCWGRVTFIKPDGTWVDSYEDYTADTEIVITDGDYAWQKKDYCKNNSSLTYTASCIGWHF